MYLGTFEDDHTLAEPYKSYRLKAQFKCIHINFLEWALCFWNQYHPLPILWFAWAHSGCVFYLSGKDHLHVRCSKHTRHSVIIRPRAASRGFVLLGRGGTTVAASWCSVTMMRGKNRIAVFARFWFTSVWILYHLQINYHLIRLGAASCVN